MPHPQVALGRRERGENCKSCRRCRCEGQFCTKIPPVPLNFEPPLLAAIYCAGFIFGWSHKTGSSFGFELFLGVPRPFLSNHGGGLCAETVRDPGSCEIHQRRNLEEQDHAKSQATHIGNSMLRHRQPCYLGPSHGNASCVLMRILWQEAEMDPGELPRPWIPLQGHQDLEGQRGGERGGRS